MEVENGKNGVAIFPIEKYEKSRYKKEFRSQNDLVHHLYHSGVMGHELLGPKSF
jgi:hypothetical protein